MAINIRTVRLQAPATNIEQDYTITDFGDVQAVMVWAGIAGDGSDVASVNQSAGFWDTTNVACWTAYAEDNVAIATAKSKSIQSSANIVEMLVGATVERNATIATTTDGVTLTWDGVTLSLQPYVIVTLINGINGAQAGAFTPHADDVTELSETTTGITPKVIFGGMNTRNLIDGAAAWKSFSFGFAYNNGSSIDQRAVVWNGIETVSAKMQSPNDTRIALNPVTSNIDTSLEITAMASGSFTAKSHHDSGTGSEDSDLYYLALGFDGDAAVFTSQVTTAAGNWTPLTGESFTPGSAVMLPTFSATVNDINTTVSAGFYGLYIADGTNEYQLGFNDEDDAATNSNASGRTDEMLWNSGELGGTPDFIASNPQFSSGQIQYLDADVTHSVTAKASYVFGIAFEAATGVTITDVDTDEIWDDGDTGLVITGTGFV